MPSSRPEPSADWRGAPRTLFTPGAPCLLVAPPDYRRRPGVVRDVSRSGVGLLLAEPLPEGTVLGVRPETPAGASRVATLRVRHATALDDGRWLVGCAHVTALPPAELSALREALEAHR
jgi:hypothetical protein